MQPLLTFHYYTPCHVKRVYAVKHWINRWFCSRFVNMDDHRINQCNNRLYDWLVNYVLQYIQFFPQHSMWLLMMPTRSIASFTQLLLLATIVRIAAQVHAILILSVAIHSYGASAESQGHDESENCCWLHVAGLVVLCAFPGCMISAWMDPFYEVSLTGLLTHYPEIDILYSRSKSVWWESCEERSSQVGSYSCHVILSTADSHDRVARMSSVLETVNREFRNRAVLSWTFSNELAGALHYYRVKSIMFDVALPWWLTSA